ncbi:MAG: hypothetical protein R2711_12965 [Acidimicrobiales bacterium]
MASPRARWALAYVAATAVLVAGIAVLIARRADPTPGGRPAPSGLALEPMPFPTTLDVVGPAAARVGDELPIDVAAAPTGEVAEVRVFDGARLVVRAPGTVHGGAVAAAVPMLEPGEHLLHAEVVDDDGAVARTPPTMVAVAPAPGDGPWSSVVAIDAGETAADVAARLDVDPEQVAIDATGTQATVTIEVAAPPDEGATTDEPGATASSSPDPAPGTPALRATVRGCEVELTSDGGPIVGTGAGDVGWARVGVGTARLDGTRAGTSLYVARGATGDSPPVAVTVPPGCASAAGWRGDVSIVGGVLSLPTAASGVYLFLSTPGRPAVRVPAVPDQTFAAGIQTPIAHLLPALDGASLDVEAWRWSELPVRIGTGHLELPDGASLASVIGEPGAVDLQLATEGGLARSLTMGHADRELSFRWQAGLDAVGAAQWQVLAAPPGQDDLRLAPAELLATGRSDAAARSERRSGRRGSFSVDTAAIARRPGSTTRPGGAPGAGEATPLVVYAPPSSPRGLALPDPATYGRTVPAGVDDEHLAAASIAPRPGDTVWVRVLALSEGDTVVGSSPTVPIVLPVPETPETGVSFDVESLTVDPGRAPNPRWADCLAVTVPWTGPSTLLDTGAPISAADQQAAVASHLYPTSRTYCPSDFPPPDDCDAWYCTLYDAVVDGVSAVGALAAQYWGLISHAYNGAIDTVVSVIAAYNPICVGLSAAEDGAGHTCAAVAAVVTRAAITAVLASVGLPPSLPTPDQAEAIAAGDATALGVALLEEAGIPCDDLAPAPELTDAFAAAGADLGVGGAIAADPCRGVVELIVGALAEEVTASVAQARAGAVGLPYVAIPGLTYLPDPRGLADPLRVAMVATVERPEVDATGAVCHLDVRDPASQLRAGPGPYRWNELQLTEDDPLDGTGRWSGQITLPTDQDVGDPVAALQGLTVAVEVRDLFPSSCQVPTTTATATIAPADP